MRIGIVTTSYPRFAGDPAGHFVAEHAHALLAQGHQIDVLAAGAPEIVHGALLVERIPAHPSLFYRGGAPDALEAATPRTLLAAAAFSARLTLAVARRAPRWDAIIAHWLAPSALAALPTRAPLTAIAHGGDVFTLRRAGLLRAALHALHRRRARLAFVSAELRAVALAAAPELAAYLAAALVQPMGLDLGRLAAIPRAPTTPPTVLIAARLTPIKGVDTALAALAYLQTPARLVILGDGPERARLVAAAPAHVTWAGAVTTAERDAHLARASIVVVPSRVLPDGRAEGTPLIALEALAAGIPVVATATGGLRALAPAALLVPPDHPALLAAAIDHALVAPPDRRHLQAAVAHLGWPAVAAALAPTHLTA